MYQQSFPFSSVLTQDVSGEREEESVCLCMHPTTPPLPSEEEEDANVIPPPNRSSSSHSPFSFILPPYALKEKGGEILPFLCDAMAALSHRKIFSSLLT